jgi:hypothetical protein
MYYLRALAPESLDTPPNIVLNVIHHMTRQDARICLIKECCECGQEISSFVAETEGS